MLARVANSLYWMSRYIERAENTARFIEVNLQFTLDPSVIGGEQWEPLVQITGDAAAFRERHDEPTAAAVLEFLTLDRGYPNSIIACIAAARENARMSRDVITADMWRHLNAIYLELKDTTTQQLLRENAGQFFDRIAQACLLFDAAVEASLSRTQGYHFVALGRALERADKTLRLMDVKYFMLLPEAEDVGTTLDTVQWADLLRSASALEMYRQCHGAIETADGAAFLTMNDKFPRSVAFCLNEANWALEQINQVSVRRDNRTNPARRRLGRLRAELEFGDMGEIIGSGLHEFLDEMQLRLNRIDDAVNQTYFQRHAKLADPPATPGADAEDPSAMSQTQTQSAS